MRTPTLSRLPSTPRSRRLARAVRPVVEAVERRTLMSAVLANGVLTVTGTVAADPITVTFVADDPQVTTAAIDVTVDGVSTTYAPAAVTAVRVVGANVAGAGDTITVQQSPADNGSAGGDTTFQAFYNDPLTVTGGGGADTIHVALNPYSYAQGTLKSVAVDAGGGNDTVVYDGASPATLHGGAGNDDLTDHAGAAVYVYGDDGNDALHVGTFVTDAATAHLYGGAGNDTFTLGDIDYQTFISGGDGTDTLDLTRAEFAPQNDVIDLRGPGGPPGHAGDNLAFLDATTENLTDPSGAFEGQVIGNGSANVLVTPYASTVMGLGGNDRITFGANAAVDAGDGNDTLVAAPGSYNDGTRLSGGAGTDVVDYGAATAGQLVYLDGSQPGTAGDTFDGSVEQVYGSPFNDVVYGTAGNNALYGEVGDDTLIGNGGSDAFLGGDGNDTVYANDAKPSYVDGGGGTDTAYADRAGDQTVNVERVVPSAVAASTARLTGTTFGTAGSFGNRGNTVAKATDGNLNTFYDAATSDGGFVGIDLGAARTVTQIKYAPRAGYASRMELGYFQGAADSTFTGQRSEPVYVYTAPAVGTLTAVDAADTNAYRYWRYVAPQNSYGNIAEFQLFGPVVPPAAGPAKLAATTFGTAGSFGNSGNTLARAADGDVSTFFDAPAANGAVVGLDLGAARAVSQIAFAPRAGYANRMVGGAFQASNTADFSSGVATVYTVKAAPASGALTTVATGTTTAYRYWRYVAPANSYGNVAEFQLFA